MLPWLLVEITVKNIIFHSFLHREKLQYSVTADIKNTHLLFKIELVNGTVEIQFRGKIYE